MKHNSYGLAQIHAYQSKVTNMIGINPLSYGLRNLNSGKLRIWLYNLFVLAHTQLKSYIKHHALLYAHSYSALRCSVITLRYIS